MKLKIEADLVSDEAQGNTAEDRYGVAHEIDEMLHDVINDIVIGLRLTKHTRWGGEITDFNGNTCGSWSIEDTNEEKG